MDLVFHELSQAFGLPPPDSITPLGSGHIHKTYYMRCENSEFIVQKFNSEIFTKPDLVEGNYFRLSQALAGNPIFNLGYLQTTSGSIFQQINKKLWRISPFIPNTSTFDRCESPAMAYQAAKAFATFIKELAKVDPHEFKESIPHFLDPWFRQLQFKKALRSSDRSLKAKAENLIALYEEHNPTNQNEIWTSRLPLRTIHADTKINNILFRKDGSVCSVIDVDTVMPGYVMCDFGDLVRTTCNAASEDDPGPGNTGLKTGIYDELLRGFRDADFLNKLEMESLPFGAKLMTWLTGIRFLTDYLNGDIYYKIERPNQNFDRAWSQMNFLQKLNYHFP